MWDCDHLDHVANIFAWQARPDMRMNTGWVWPRDTEGVELLIKGRSRLDVDGVSHRLLPGAMIWHQAGDRTIHAIDPRAPYQAVSIKFAISRPPRVRPPRLTVWNDPEECQSFAAEALAVFHRGGFHQHEFCRYLYTRMQWQVHRSQIGGVDGSPPVLLRPAMDIIEHQFSRRISVAELARAAGLSPTHLHRLFQKHLGDSPLDMLIRRRLGHASLLLTHDVLSVRQVGIESGFPDAVHFSRSFKRSYGCTPLEYRRRHAYGSIVR